MSEQIGVDPPTDTERNLVGKDVPTLAEVWRTAPYLQDGRAATMREVLTTYNPEDHAWSDIYIDIAGAG